MNLFTWLTRKSREQNERMERSLEASIDHALYKYHLHALSEDMGFPGDPSWFCEDAEVGDGHMHRLPVLYRSDALYMQPEVKHGRRTTASS